MLPIPRSDGVRARIPAYRRIMPFIMRTRNESAVYFTQTLDLTRTLPFLDRFNAAGGPRITLFHLFAYAAIRTIKDRPRLNRFIAGGSVYDRHGIYLSYSAKKTLSDDSPMVVLKRRFEGTEDFAQMLALMGADLKEGRSAKESHVDKELALFLRLPALLLALGVRVINALYNLNLLPRAFFEPDPLFASMFIANLGSLKMKAAYHHLYEYGNIPLFAVVGRVEQLPVVAQDGTVVARPMAEIRYTLDERVEDGLYCAQSLELVRNIVENPEAHIRLPQAAGQLPANAA
jgi:hypothetical protein